MFIFILAALLSTSAAAEGAPYVGDWDCLGSIASFDPDSFDNGDEFRKILEAVRDDRGS
jgi:hypothetical protein